jgi:hypothetical protein
MRTKLCPVLLCMAALLRTGSSPVLGQSLLPVNYAHRILSNRPFPPTDTSLVRLGYYDVLPDVPPALGDEPTEEQAYVLLLNSGLGSHLGVYATNGNSFVLPDVEAGRSWFDAVTQGLPVQPVATPGNPLLAQYLQMIQEPGNPPPPPADFNKAVLDWIDQNQGTIQEGDLVRAATALEMDVAFVRQ